MPSFDSTAKDRSRPQSDHHHGNQEGQRSKDSEEERDEEANACHTEQVTEVDEHHSVSVSNGSHLK